MKKFILYLSLFSILYFGGSKIRSERKLYLKKETYLQHVKKDLLQKKLHSPLPDWMKQQIDEDFLPFQRGGISKEKVDATFHKIQQTNPSPLIVRYRILNNQLYRYFPKNELISLEDNSTELALKTLLASHRLPNIDFILSFSDGIRSDENYFKVSKDVQAPLFFSAKEADTENVILIPDWRSIGHWWISDIKHILSRAGKFPWEKKKDFSLWRGSLTKPIRRTLCEISKRYPHYLDAKFNTEENLEIKEELIKEGLFGNRVSWEEFLGCKYLPVMDGVVCAAPAFQWRLLSGSVTLKPDSKEVQWFYRNLKPYVHYIPLQSDLTDLIEKLEWAKEHDLDCKQIAERAALFAKESLMYEDVLLYFFQVLTRYGKLQAIDPRQIGEEMKEDPDWVCIQYRKNLKEKGALEQMNRYFPGPTPF